MSDAVNNAQDLNAAFEDLAGTLEGLIEQALRARDVFEQRKLLDQERLEIENRLVRAVRERMKLERDQLEQAREAGNDLQSIGGVIAALVQGRLMPALQGLAGFLQGVAARDLRKREEAATGEARQEARDTAPTKPAQPKTGMPTAKKPGTQVPKPPAPQPPKPAPPVSGTAGAAAEGGAGGSAAGMTGIASMMTMAVAAIAAFVVVIGAAIAAMVRMSQVATPQAWSTLRDSMSVVSGVIGSLLTPVLFRFGQTITFLGDLLFEIVPKFVSAFEDSASSLGEFLRTSIEMFIPSIKLVDWGLTFLVKSFAWAADKLMLAAEYVVSYVSKKGASSIAKARESLNTRRKAAEGKTIGDKMVEKLDTLVASFADKTKVGGKSISERWADAGKEFAAATMQKLGSGTARFEATADSYKRIQQAAIGQTSYEQKMLDIAFKNADAMAKVAYNTDKLASREGPLRK